MKPPSLDRIIAGGFVVVLMLLFGVGIASLYSINTLLDATRLSQHTYHVLNQLERLSSDVNAIYITQRNFILTGDSSELDDFDRGLGQLRQDATAIHEMVGDNPEQVSNSRKLASALEARTSQMRRRVDLSAQQGFMAVSEDISRHGVDTTVNTIIDRMRTVEERLLTERSQVAAQLGGDARRAILLGSALAVLAVLGSLWVALREIRMRAHAHGLLQDREERLQDFLENATELIGMADANGQLVYVNRAWRARLKYDAEKREGAPYLDAVAPEYRAAAREAFQRLMQGEEFSGFETVLLSGDGQHVPVVGHISVRWEDGKPAMARWIFRDVTEERAAQRTKDEFLSVISHELRTPLTSIRGALGLLATGKLGELNVRGERLLAIAAEDTERLVRMVNDLLDVERLESGRVSLHRQSVEAASIVQRAVEIVQPLAERAGVTVDTEVAALTLWADSDRVLQTLTNLLDNAIKFSPTDSTIRVHVESDKNHAAFSVVDQGRGIPPASLERIFSRFEQIDASDSRQKGGTGLGLAIAKAIVEQHGGAIRVESDGVHGSTFRFTIPRTASLPGEASADSDKPLVLVAEDDPNAAAVITEMVEAQGFRVVHAADGAEAVRQAQALLPVVILLDLSMPGMSGAAALNELKKDPLTRSIPVVIASGLARGDIALPGADLLEWIRKPVGESSLSEALDRALTKNASARSVLVVEDDKALADVLCSWLHASGIRARHAATAQEALNKSEGEPPDLVVLDLHLPDGNGFDVAEQLRATVHAGTPILVYTGIDVDAWQRARLGNIEVMHKGRHDPHHVTRRVAMLLNQLARNGTVGN